MNSIVLHCFGLLHVGTEKPDLKPIIEMDKSNSSEENEGKSFLERPSTRKLLIEQLFMSSIGISFCFFRGRRL